MTYGWYSRVAEDKTKRLIHGLLVTQTQFCMFYRSVVSKTGAFKNRKAVKSVSVPILAYVHESRVMTERMLSQVILQIILSQVQVAEMGFL